MILTRVALFVFTFACWLPGLLAQVTIGGEGLAEQYLRGYMMNSEAERQVQAGNLAGAKELYTQALAVMDTVAKTDPRYQPSVVAYRRDKITIALAKVQAKLAAPTPPPPAPAPAVVAPAATGLSALPATAPGQSLGNTAVPSAPSPAGAPVPLDDYFNGIKAAIQQQLQASQQQQTDLFAKVGQYQLQYETALTQRDELARNYQQLSATALAQQGKLKELEASVASGAATQAELDASKKALVATTEQLADSKERLTKVEHSVMNQSKQLMEVSMKLTAAEHERDALAKEKATAVADRDKVLAERDLVAVERDRLSKDRDAISLKLLGLQAQYDQLKKLPQPTGKMANVSDEMKALAADNDRLKKALETARQQVESLKGDVTRKDQEIVQLKGTLTKIQGELNTLKKENAGYAAQVNDLTLQLKNIKTQAELASGKSPTKEVPQLQEENDLLKSIIQRQLRQQARQQTTKTLVIGQLQKMGDDARGLVDEVEQLGGVRITLTPAEQKLFTVPELKEFLSTGGIQSTFVAKSEAPVAPADASASISPLSGAAALDSLLNNGNDALAKGQLPAAATAYLDALRADPKNASAFAGLAWTRLQQGDLNEAESTLRKSLLIDPNIPTAHYMLGVTHFRQNKQNEAMKSFEKSLELEAKNSRAHHYLGIIATQQGLLERAEREFKASLAIDPTYAEGYFNLAVLYVTWDPPKWDEAKKNYSEAVKKGLKPDANLEKILNGAAVSAR
jgi:tetratricopeptide (TPR) repeat protein